MDNHALLNIAREAMRQRGLQPDFSAAAQSEAAAMSEPISPGEPAVRDLRDLLWCSIDNDDSRDLDQLTVALPEAGSVQRILVAIADVDTLVLAGSAIDAHARANTTSVYTAAGIFPMLPLRLSTDLSSLNENRDRLAIVIAIEIAVGEQGALGDAQVFRALVRNQAQLTYNGVADWLDGKAPMPAKVAALPGSRPNCERRTALVRR